MRLGGKIYNGGEDFDALAKQHVELGYRAAYSPDLPANATGKIREAREAFARHDVLIAEVGVWNNMLHTDEAQRKEALAVNIEKMALAEEIGARCCVNIAGSYSPDWDGPDDAGKGLSEDCFAATVDNVRAIIDAVQPKTAKFALETMPWVFPHNTDDYVRLVQAIDRPAFGVHFDPVNLVHSVDVYYHTGDLVKDFVAKLGKHIVSVHAKDARLSGPMPVSIHECLIGDGGFDYTTFLQILATLPADLPVMLEHLKNMEGYAENAWRIRAKAKAAGVAL